MRNKDLANEKPSYSLWQLIRYFLKLGTVGFGGPVALIGYMRRDLVEERKWIQEIDYKDGVVLAQLAPGPMATQTAIYIAYVHYRILGATLVGITFVLPSFLMVVALGVAYKLYGGLVWMQAVFYGVSASVIGIIAVSAYHLTKKTIAKDWLLWVIYIITALFTVITESEQGLLFILSGILVWLIKSPPKIKWPPANTSNLMVLSILPLNLLFFPAGATSQLLRIFGFFSKAGAFVFGSGLAIVPFLYGGGWLNSITGKAAQMDAVYVFSKQEEKRQYISPDDCYVHEGYYYPYYRFGWHRYHPRYYYPRGYYYSYGYQSTIETTVFISAVGIAIKYTGSAS
ncbi:MAG: chromate efflux transporter [Candidatus Omnitrophica bacterium]|nr:chromate efflux transporter [Candidatus Omnitrophota bacterium]